MAHCRLAALPALEQVEAWAEEPDEPALRRCQELARRLKLRLDPDAQMFVLVQARLVAAYTWLADRQHVLEGRCREPGHPDTCSDRLRTEAFARCGGDYIIEQVGGEAHMLYLELLSEYLQPVWPALAI